MPFLAGDLRCDRRNLPDHRELIALGMRRLVEPRRESI